MTVEGHEVVLNIVLPAGSTENINPFLIGGPLKLIWDILCMRLSYVRTYMMQSFTFLPKSMIFCKK